jgi:hypothetical protein
MTSQGPLEPVAAYREEMGEGKSVAAQMRMGCSVNSFILTMYATVPIVSDSFSPSLQWVAMPKSIILIRSVSFSSRISRGGNNPANEEDLKPIMRRSAITLLTPRLQVSVNNTLQMEIVYA